MSRRDETQTIKPIINEAFDASSGDIITDYNDLYCLYVNITMFSFVTEETQTISATLHVSKLTFESLVANSLNNKTYLQAVSQKLVKLELLHFIESL